MRCRPIKTQLTALLKNPMYLLNDFYLLEIIPSFGDAYILLCLYLLFVFIFYANEALYLVQRIET